MLQHFLFPGTGMYPGFGWLLYKSETNLKKIPLNLIPSLKQNSALENTNMGGENKIPTDNQFLFKNCIPY